MYGGMREPSGTEGVTAGTESEFFSSLRIFLSGGTGILTRFAGVFCSGRFPEHAYGRHTKTGTNSGCFRDLPQNDCQQIFSAGNVGRRTPRAVR